MSLRKTIGINIKKLRITKELTQQELAEKAGIDYKYYQKIEGKNPPNLKIDTIEKVAKTLNIIPSKLLEK